MVLGLTFGSLRTHDQKQFAFPPQTGTVCPYLENEDPYIRDFNWSKLMKVIVVDYHSAIQLCL